MMYGYGTATNFDCKAESRWLREVSKRNRRYDDPLGIDGYYMMWGPDVEPWRVHLRDGIDWIEQHLLLDQQAEAERAARELIAAGYGLVDISRELFWREREPHWSEDGFVMNISVLGAMNGSSWRRDVWIARAMATARSDADWDHEEPISIALRIAHTYRRRPNHFFPELASQMYDHGIDGEVIAGLIDADTRAQS